LGLNDESMYLPWILRLFEEYSFPMRQFFVLMDRLIDKTAVTEQRARQNPHWMQEVHTQHPVKLNVWAAIFGDNY
jgi:hypothetical protein